MEVLAADDLAGELVEAARAAKVEAGIRIVAGGRVDAFAVMIVVQNPERFEITGEILSAIARWRRRWRHRVQRMFGEY